METKVGQTTVGELLPFIFALIFLVVILIICIVGLVSSVKASRVKRKRKSLAKRGIFQTTSGVFSHCAGLPIPNNVRCSLTLSEDKLTINATGIEFNICIDKLVSFCLKTEQDIQENTQYVSSIGGAIAGAALLGIPGAIVGGRAKKKTNKTVTVNQYLVVTYKKEDDICYLLFNVGMNLIACEFIENFNILTKDRTPESIEL